MVLLDIRLGQDMDDFQEEEHERVGRSPGCTFSQAAEARRRNTGPPVGELVYIQNRQFSVRRHKTKHVWLSNLHLPISQSLNSFGISCRSVGPVGREPE